MEQVSVSKPPGAKVPPNHLPSLRSRMREGERERERERKVEIEFRNPALLLMRQ